MFGCFFEFQSWIIAYLKCRDTETIWEYVTFSWVNRNVIRENTHHCVFFLLKLKKIPLINIPSVENWIRYLTQWKTTLSYLSIRKWIKDLDRWQIRSTDKRKIYVATDHFQCTAIKKCALYTYILRPIKRY